MNKKIVIVLMLVITIGIVGLTIAYFSNTSSITNIFSTNPYGTTVTEEFVSPTNWLPGTETEKTLTVTNSGSVDEAVRVSYTEIWTSANSNVEGNLPLSQNGNAAALINWTNTDDWTTVNENNKTYKYYNYKLSPNETTSELLDKVTFNPLITNSATCDESESNGVKTITCNSNGSGYDGATYKLVFTIETVQYNKYVEAWGTNVVIAEEKPQPEPTGVEYLATEATNPVNAQYNATTKGKMFVFTHGEGANQVTESRYIGNDPNNYVYFNCTDDEDTSTCEKWRIIGTFDVERTDPTDSTKTITETRMKLVRGNSIKNDKWNTAQNTNGGYNDWTADNATLKLFLNGAYYNNTGDAQTGGYGLQESARNMIEDAKYYLGAFEPYSSLTTEQLYSNERGSTLCASCGTDTQKLTWIGKVGLMYPSDMYMTYKGVNDACYNTPAKSNCNSKNASTGWVYNSNKLSTDTNPYSTWFLSPLSSSSHNVFCAYSDGPLSGYYADNVSSGVRPVVYLKSDIKIDGGTGEVGSPYVLK